MSRRTVIGRVKINPRVGATNVTLTIVESGVVNQLSFPHRRLAGEVLYLYGLKTRFRRLLANIGRIQERVKSA
jgi:hypothetical protein